ncbi:6-phosphofructokinase [Jannaschia faecimaris]|uniref:Ribokinase n=1 Tax=Jannaschia faecimaris TaxID=1244108 RepID=A0A1H3QWI0_9RHOB|nr:ribokinase [Jannaschia faecimaris]SDZ17385.1 6-phosphofructokinase [Jannaschia faecimaris]
MGHVAILGVFVADTTFNADRQPRMGETILGNSFTLGPGGKGSNQAVAAGRAGGEAHFVARIGRDAFGDMARKVWAEAGVTPAVIDSDEATGAAMIFIEAGSGDNAIIVVPGAAGGITPADVEARADVIGGASVFITQLEQPMDAAMRGLEIAREGGAATILNPAPAAELPEGMLSLCDYITPNETEAEALSGIAVRDLTSARAAADALLAMGVAKAVIVTLGAQGVLYHDRDRSVPVPAITAGPVVETTGAGDAFNGAFATGLAEGMDPVAAARFGCACAGLSVTRPGAAASMPTRAEIDKLL